MTGGLFGPLLVATIVAVVVRSAADDRGLTLGRWLWAGVVWMRDAVVKR